MTAGNSPRIREPAEQALCDAIAYECPWRYNASQLLYDNLDAGRGDAPAVIADTGTWSYAALCAQANRIGALLLERGLSVGDRVLLVLDDEPVYPAAIMGTMKAGLVPILVNTLSPPDLVRYYAEDSGARAAIVSPPHCALFDNAAVDRGVCATVLVHGSAPAGMIGWHAVTDTADRLHEAPTTRDDPAFWMYSSGTTGRPKGIVHRHEDALYTHASYARHFLRLTPNDICFSVPKVFFAYGFGNSITFPFAAGAAGVLMAERPDPARIFEQIERHRPSVLFGLPTLYTALVRHASADSADLSSLRLCISAAEVLSGDVFGAWKDRFGLDIIEGLGSTEALHIYLSNTEDAHKLGSAGRTVPGYAVRLRTQDGREADDGEEGVLEVRGASCARSYWNRPEDTAKTMRDGWIWTGDRFVRDGEGFHFFRGRADDLVKVSGQWLWPLEIELALNEHPKVYECAVLAIEMADRRMTVKAFVVARADVVPDERLAEELKAYAKQRLLPHKYPREIRFLDILPKTGTDKIDRQALKAGAGEP